VAIGPLNGGQRLRAPPGVQYRKKRKDLLQLGSCPCQAHFVLFFAEASAQLVVLPEQPKMIQGGINSNSFAMILTNLQRRGGFSTPHTVPSFSPELALLSQDSLSHADENSDCCVKSKIEALAASLIS
jgi:hypothetical protein